MNQIEGNTSLISIYNSIIIYCSPIFDTFIYSILVSYSTKGSSAPPAGCIP